MTPESSKCDWCGREIESSKDNGFNVCVFKLYGGMRLHMHCYEEFVNEQFYNGDL